MNYWLVKQEPESYSFSDFQKEGKTDWTGVRNFTARNNLKEMKVGDKVLFYASNADPSGVTGLAEVSREAYPDPADETWTLVDIRFAKKFPHTVSLETLKSTPGLEEMVVTKKGSRLSIQPVTKKEYEIVVKMGKK